MSTQQTLFAVVKLNCCWCPHVVEDTPNAGREAMTHHHETAHADRLAVYPSRNILAATEQGDDR